jgi:hypothetical protein
MKKKKAKWPRSVSVRLRPSEIAALKRLSERFGGVGRAIQTATELLRESSHRRKQAAATKEEKLDNATQVLFSFPVYKRTRDLMNRLGNRYYVKTNHLIRACIRLLEALEREDEILPGIPADEMHDPDRPSHRAWPDDDLL